MYEYGLIKQAATKTLEIIEVWYVLKI